MLDEFLSKRGENLIRDPLQRAFLQHDLWAPFDWSAAQRSDQYPRERAALQRRLARIIRSLALNGQEIAALPDNYARTAADTAVASLPRGLFERRQLGRSQHQQRRRTAPRAAFR